MNKRRTTRPHRLVRRLTAYTAAGAVVSSALDSDAAIVYSPLDSSLAYFGELDLNADGSVDFDFIFDAGTLTWGCHVTTSGYRSCSSSAGSNQWSVAYGTGRAGNFIVAVDDNVDPVARAFAPYEAIATTSIKAPRAILFGCSSDICSQGEFFQAGTAYLGVQFADLSQGQHQGWIGVETSSFRELSFFGFAYETVPGRPILAGAVPEPPSLVLLAAGAAGLALVRRRRSTHHETRSRTDRTSHSQPR